MANKSRTSAFRKKLNRLMHARNIVVVSQHAVDHYSLSFRMQMAIIMTIISIVGIASYSTGRFIEAQSMIAEKDRTIETTTAESQKIAGRFELLRDDLLRMTREEDAAGLSDYAQFVIEQYQNPSHGASDFTLDTSDIDGSTLLERINYLESQLERQQFRQQHFMNAVRHMTRNKIRALEKAVEMTGMDDEVSSIIDKALIQELAENKARVEASLAQGGPFEPYEGQLDEKATEETVLREVSYLVEMADIIQSLPIQRPMRGARYTSGFGKRIDPFKRRLAQHNGIDYAGPLGSKIYATAAGKVTYIGYKGSYGRTVDIDHGNGFMTRYSHLSRILVKKGAEVEAGKAIGIQGTTGRSTGHHLHYEVRYHGIPVNPSRFIKAGTHVSQALK